MPFGGNDWLALTPEPTLEPEIPICDPHHHSGTFGRSVFLINDICSTS